MKREDITNIFPEATPEQINSLMSIHGNDINQTKGNFDALKEQLQTANEQLTALQAGADEAKETAQRLSETQAELDALKGANAIRDIREKVSTETGVPISLLTADTEEGCTQQAEAIKAFAKPTAYPKVTDGGEVGNISKKTTRQQFADWFNSNT